MALQVWLPLNGNLKNKGLGKVTNNLTTGVVNDNGKFGKCYACKSGAYLSFDYTLKTTSDFSLAFWVKVPSTITTAAAWQAMLSFSTNDGSDITTQISWANYNQMKIYDDSTHQHAWLTIEYDTWLHFVITNRFSDGKNYVQIFKNGVLLGTYTSTTELKIRSGLLALGSGINATYGPIYYNDVRIYDNCLNNVDARELYLGKVLEFTPQWVDNTRIADASGLNFPLTPYNITVTGGEAKFNGSSSYIQFNGLNLKSGGTVSIWANLPAKPNVQRIYYCDPTSKMVVGYLGGGTILSAANGSKPSYQSTGITWKNMHHIVAVYGNDRNPSALYVNGVQPATGTQTTWTNSGDIASIGRRIGSGGADYLSGSVNEVKVFSTQLTAAEVKELYNNGADSNSWTPSEPIWMRVLHHNNPKAARFASIEDGKDKDTEDQFSKLKIFFNNDNYRRSDGTYEFMVKEKLESGSTEQVFRWKQTSNPTASTVTGYQLISQTMNPNRSFGLKCNGSYAVFHNGSTWWCACGAFSAFNNGIPGFGGTVLTGYIDLYVRVDK